MPSTAIRYPAGVFGYEASTPSAGGAVVEPFIAAAAIAAGQAVELDFTASPAKVKVATTGGASQLFVGIASESAAAGESCLVTMMGNAVAKVSANVTIGDRLGRSGTTAGELVVVAAATGVTASAHLGTIWAVALEGITTSTVVPIKVLVAKM